VARGRRNGERGRKTLGPAAPLGGRTRTRKEARGPRERVRLLERGKLCRATPGARAAWNKAAKRRGATANGGTRKGFVRAASAARTVERGKNPEDGTGGGLATSTLSAVVARPRRSDEGAPGVVVLEGARTPGEAIPGLVRPPRLRKQLGAKPEQGQPRRGPALKGKRTPGEDLPRLTSRGSGWSGKTPRPS